MDRCTFSGSDAEACMHDHRSGRACQCKKRVILHASVSDCFISKWEEHLYVVLYRSKLEEGLVNWHRCFSTANIEICMNSVQIQRER
jgi:hypothetical protein